MERPLEGEIRIPSGCAVSAIIDRSGKTMTGADIIKSIASMHDRSNGLGGGFAGYGIFFRNQDEKDQRGNKYSYNLSLLFIAPFKEIAELAFGRREICSKVCKHN